MSAKLSHELGGDAGTDPGRRALLQRSLLGGILAAGAALGSMPRAALAADAKADEPISIALFAMFVSDLDRSVEFYRALGFEGGEPAKGPANPNPMTSKLYQTAGGVVSRSVRKDGITLEFLHFEALKPAARRPGPELGLSHVSLRVDDVDRVAALVKKMGGSVMEETRVANGVPGKGVQILFCADPDGSRIALLGPIKA